MKSSSLDTWYLQLTDRCTNSCAHCFSSCSPAGRRTLDITFARKILRQMSIVRRCRVVFTGGEPFLLFPLLRNLVHEASTLELTPSVWTNGYWITGIDEFRLSLRYLSDVGLKELILSDDGFHGVPPFAAIRDQLPAIATELGISLLNASHHAKNPPDPPDIIFADHHVLTGTIMHRGRAADQCTGHQTLWDPADFDACPHLDFHQPLSLFVDVLGQVNVCPHFPLASLHQISLKKFFQEFDPAEHPTTSAILAGGPHELAQRNSIPLPTGFVDFCHACWHIRSRMK